MVSMVPCSRFAEKEGEHQQLRSLLRSRMVDFAYLRLLPEHGVVLGCSCSGGH